MSVNFEKLKAFGKYRQLFLDFVVKEEVCNLSCDYCMNEHTQLKDDHGIERIGGKLKFKLDELDELVYQAGYRLKAAIDKVLSEYQKIFDTPVLKISGGEILLVKNISELIKRQSDSFEVIQLLTNGTLINQDFINQIKHINNLHIQLSLDGHTLEMNYNRVKTQALQDRLLRVLDSLVENDIITEIYCVINKLNVNGLPDFAEYLSSRYKGKVQLFPFPVRQHAGKTLLPEEDNLQGISEIIQHYDSYISILPPLPYMEELYNFIRMRKRALRCLIPLVAAQVFDDGVITPCPNCWTVKTGNLIESSEGVAENLGKSRVYKLMTNCPPIAPFCFNCFTEVDVVNLYFQDRVELKELAESRPLYRGPRVQSTLSELKKIFTSMDFESSDIKKLSTQNISGVNSL